MNFHTAYIQRHEKSNSRYNYVLDWEEGIDKHRLLRNTGFYIQFEMEERSRLLTKDYTCDPTNNIKLNDCINRVIEDKMKCNLPWIRNHFKGMYDFIHAKLSTFL